LRSDVSKLFTQSGSNVPADIGAGPGVTQDYGRGRLGWRKQSHRLSSADETIHWLWKQAQTDPGRKLRAPENGRCRWVISGFLVSIDAAPGVYPARNRKAVQKYLACTVFGSLVQNP